MADNKRLIDANSIKYHTERECGGHGIFYDITMALKEDIDALPTVDAVEVVHGRWEDAYDGKYANPRYRCSVCKEKALFKFERDCLGHHNDVQALTPFCPYCMAKLDGGKDNDT